jgi:hypothetical protein
MEATRSATRLRSTPVFNISPRDTYSLVDASTGTASQAKSPDTSLADAMVAFTLASSLRTSAGSAVSTISTCEPSLPRLQKAQ